MGLSSQQSWEQPNSNITSTLPSTISTSEQPPQQQQQEVQNGAEFLVGQLSSGSVGSNNVNNMAVVNNNCLTTVAIPVQQLQQQQHQTQQTHQSKIHAVVANIPLGVDSSMDDVNDKPKFILAPTPAQLGKAPRQKRLSSHTDQGQSALASEQLPNQCLDGSMAPPRTPDVKVSPGANNNNNSINTNNLEGDVSTPGYTPNTPSVPPSPSGKKSFFKKNIEDGMDKVLEQVNFEQKFVNLPEFNPDEVNSPTVSGNAASSVPSSPRTFISSYRRKRKLSAGGEESEAETPMSAMTATPQLTPSSVALQGSKFFGPDFNPEVFKEGPKSFIPDMMGEGLGDMDSPAGGRSPRTPKTPRDATMGDKSSHSSLRHILDQRRNLVMQLFSEAGWFPTGQAVAGFQARYSEIFPTKNCLILKIREVRQKVHQTTPTPNTPGGPGGGGVTVPNSPNPNMVAATANMGNNHHLQYNHHSAARGSLVSNVSGGPQGSNSLPVTT